MTNRKYSISYSYTQGYDNTLFGYADEMAKLESLIDHDLDLSSVEKMKKWLTVVSTSGNN